MTLDWSPLAIATVALACVAVWSILQTRATQRSERRQRPLNDIIEWAIDVVKCSFGRPITIIPQLGRKTQRALGLGNTLLEYQALETKAKYIAKVAETFEKELQNTVASVCANLVSVRVALKDYITKMDDEAWVQNYEGCLQQLSRSAITLMEQAAKIKTKDID